MLSKKWWSSKWKRLYCRIVREKASPEYIARGWAIGMFYGCVIPFGFQLICSIPTSFLLRGSKLGATLGTLLTNHFTIFIIYPIQCWAGSHVIGRPISFAAVDDAMQSVIKEQSYSALMALGWELVIAFFVGGFLLAAVCTPVTYWGVKRMVAAYRQKKAAKQQRIVE